MNNETSELTLEQRAKFCSTMLEKYGVKIDVDNEMLPMYYVAYQSTLLSKQAVKNMEASVKRTNEGLRQMVLDFDHNINYKLENFKAELSKFETKQYRFSSPKEAFLFSFGYYGLPILGVAFFLFFAFMFYQYKTKEVATAGHISHWMESAEIQHNQHKNTLIPSIRLYPVDDISKARAGKNYIYNKECECIEAPLYFLQINNP